MKRRKELRLFAIAAFALALAIVGQPSSLGAEGLAGGKEHSPWSFHAELDLAFSIKAGAEYAFTDAFGVRGTLGTCFIAPLKISYTLVGISHLLPRENGFQLDIEYGLAYADVNFQPEVQWPCAYWVPGASVAVGLRMRGGHVLSLRGGAGCMMGYDMGAWQNPQLVPIIALQYDYKP